MDSSNVVHLCGQRSKLTAHPRGIRNHQYLDNKLIRAQTKEFLLLDAQSLLALCQDLGWVINLSKSELELKKTFDYVGYQYNLLHGLVRPTKNRWESLQQKLVSVLPKLTCRVRPFMSLTGLLNVTEKQGRVYTRPI